MEPSSWIKWPAPLLSVGYLAGFMDHPIRSKPPKHLAMNGAFNPGNSGGPLFKSNEDKVIGIVVSKHAPISKSHVSDDFMVNVVPLRFTTRTSVVSLDARFGSFQMLSVWEDILFTTLLLEAF